MVSGPRLLSEQIGAILKIGGGKRAARDRERERIQFIAIHKKKQGRNDHKQTLFVWNWEYISWSLIFVCFCLEVHLSGSVQLKVGQIRRSCPCSLPVSGLASGVRLAAVLTLGVREWGQV